MKKNDNFVAENATNEERIVVLNGVKMERNEHGDYKKVDKKSKLSTSLSTIACCLTTISCLLVLASISFGRVNYNSAISGKTSTTGRTVWESNTHRTESSTTEADAHEDADSTTYTLTIRYVGPSGEELCPPTKTKIKANDTYSVKVPTISGYTPYQPTTSGVMGDSDQSRDVKYDEN